MEGVNPKWKLPSDQFQVDAAAGRLPSVSWVYAPLEFDEHPPYSNPQGASMGNVTKGMQWTVDQVNAIVRGELWSDVAVFILGRLGRLVRSRRASGRRSAERQLASGLQGQPISIRSAGRCIVLGPHARNGYVSKVFHSHVGLVKFCEVNFGLPTLNQRDAAADDMTDCFDFRKTPAPAPPVGP